MDDMRAEIIIRLIKDMKNGILAEGNERIESVLHKQV